MTSQGSTTFLFVVWATLANTFLMATAARVANNVGQGVTVMNKRSIQQRHLQRYQQQQLQNMIDNATSSLSSTLPLAVIFDDRDVYYFRHPNGQVELRSSYDENKIVELMRSMQKASMRSSLEDQKSTAESLISVLRGRRRPSATDERSKSEEPVAENQSTSASQEQQQQQQQQQEDTEMLLFLADVVDRTLHDYERRAAGESIEVSDIGHETRLERIVAELQAAVGAVPPATQPEPISYMNIHPEADDNETLPVWMRFENRINQHGLYVKEDEPLVDELIDSMRDQGVIQIDDIEEAGTNLKLVLTSSDDSLGMFKPKRQSRDHELTLEVSYYRDSERHHAEIAAYHLDRLLGFRRVPPVIGIYLSFSEEMRNLTSPEFRTTFFVSPAGNLCFYGKCKMFCDPAHAVCGNDELLEGSIAYFLPNNGDADWTEVKSPWRRSYNRQTLLADWEKEEASEGEGFCHEVRQNPPYNSSERAIVNLVDLHIFDFLQGNWDRHHTYLYKKFGNDSFILTFDNGRGFGRANHDQLNILAPLYQCCSVRLSTVKTLLDFQTSPPSATEGGRLSDRMRRSLSKDALKPVITEAHLAALDRRVGIVLDQIHQCVQRHEGKRQVIYDV